MTIEINVEQVLKEQIFVAKLASLDLSSIAQRLMLYEQWDVERTTQSLKNYKTFLYLVFLNSEVQSVLTADVDLCWHHHILDTRKYAADCHDLFGFFLHHAPNRQLLTYRCDRGICEAARFNPKQREPACVIPKSVGSASL